MVYKTLPKYLKSYEIIIKILSLKLHDVSFSFTVGGFKSFRIIMKVVGSYELFTAFINELNQLLLFLNFKVK
jgi:hypothetical protein